MKKKQQKTVSRVLIIVGILFFILLFTYSNLNLKNIEYGYKMQELIQKQKLLGEEIDKLIAQKASLLNLERVEKIVMSKLGYQYPEPEQFIKVFESRQ